MEMVELRMSWRKGKEREVGGGEEKEKEEKKGVVVVFSV